MISSSSSTSLFTNLSFYFSFRIFSSYLCRQFSCTVSWNLWSKKDLSNGTSFLMCLFFILKTQHHWEVFAAHNSFSIGWTSFPQQRTEVFILNPTGAIFRLQSYRGMSTSLRSEWKPFVSFRSLAWYLNILLPCNSPFIGFDSTFT